MTTPEFIQDFLSQFVVALGSMGGENKPDLLEMIKELAAIRPCGGRLFILGVGGSAGNASHAVNDFRKLCNIETYAPTDNVSELTARTNDEGWEETFRPWLRTSRLGKADAILILSVGGGDVDASVSVNLIRAIDYAKDVKAKVLGIVGRRGYTFQQADVCILIPALRTEFVTPYAEVMQSVLLHLLVSHPALKRNETKW